MAPITIPLLKFVGTISVGLLTGVSYSSATQTLPALLSLPSASTASAALSRHASLTTLHSTALSALAVGAYGLAYALAPPRGGRHPYLLWTGLVVGVGYAVDFVKGAMGTKLQARGGVDAEEVNGEEVRRSMENWRLAAAVRSVISGTAFAMAVVGLMGEGVGVRARQAML